MAPDELRRPPGHPARRPGARRLRHGHRRRSAPRPAPRAAAAVVGAVSGLVGGYDDLAGARPEQARDKGLAGHLAALRAGRVSAGAVKVAGIGAAAAVAALLTRRGRGAGALVDGVLTTGLVAGTANLVNLLDLRPGPGRRRPVPWPPRPTLGGPAGRTGRRAARRHPRGAARGPGRAGHARRLRRQRRSARCSASGWPPSPAGRRRAGLLAGVVALTLASEKVSFTKVIEATPGLRELDRLGRRPS